MLLRHLFVTFTDRYSDGPTPADQIKQILAVTPILKGQTSCERNPIPLSRQTRESLESNRSHALQHSPVLESHQPLIPEASALPAVLPSPRNELNDPTPVPADLQAQQEVERRLAETATGAKATPGLLLDFHKGLGEALPAVKRVDSETKSLDEFVDAEG